MDKFLISILAVLFSVCSFAQDGNQTPYKLKGVIELGSAGYNAFVIQLDSKKNWKLKQAKYGQSYILEGTEKCVISQKLESYILEMQQTGVRPENIHFVVSSGAKKQKATLEIVNELRAMNYVVNVVSAKKEGKLAFKAVVPDYQKDKTMMIDVGSSNTKISWYEAGEIKSVSTYGSKYYKDQIADQEVLKDLKKISNLLPKNHSKTAYLVGGMPYKYAFQSREDSERYTTLDSLESYYPKDEKERCGALILKELRDATKIEEFIFDWDSNFSIGFLLELPY